MSKAQQTVEEAARCPTPCRTALRLRSLPGLGPSSAADERGASGMSLSFCAMVSSQQGYHRLRVNIPRVLRAAPGPRKPLSSSLYIQGDLKEPGGVRECRAAPGF